MTSQRSPIIDPSTQPLRHGVVAVIRRSERLLVIRRSQTVLAPGLLCFPGGGIEARETEDQALVRELREELDLTIQPQRRLWSSVTRWNVALVWWAAELAAEAIPVPNPAEVAEVHWMTVDELRGANDLLEGNRSFLDAIAAGVITLEARREPPQS